MKKITLLLLIFMSIGFSKTHAQGGWTQTLTYGGSARTFPSCFTIGTDV
ncbi:MAG: hypothetical protein HYZ42_03490, partial [Bacteroidetes bacterium]|nr:hypothetical protein [Bacteroidota bacterium]